jgi:hypothetical protein
MSDSDQSQRVGSRSLAVQSGGDTTIHQGMSPEDMQTILAALGAQLSNYTAIARDIADARVTDIGMKLIEKFSDPSKANSESFKDPDFQYLLTRVQHAYARSGDKGVRDILVDLIASRSKEIVRGRLSLTLNDAVEKAALLTNNEFAELSLCYLIRYTLVGGIGNVATFGERLSRLVRPLLPDISTGIASYQYIEARSCGSITPFEVTLIDAFRQNYTGVFSAGFDRTQLAGFLSEERIHLLTASGLIVPCINDLTKLQVHAVNKKLFQEAATHCGLSEKEKDDVWNAFEATVWNGEDFLQNVGKHFPELRNLQHLWEGTSLKTLTLTTIGIAIGHANLCRVSGFDADLNIWIK